MSEQEVIAKLDLTGCPIGTVFDPNETDRWVEERYFSGWNPSLSHPFWSMPSCFRVIKDGGEEVLEHIDTTDRCLVTGDEFWKDYTVSAGIRQILPYTEPFYGDEIPDTVGKSGIMFRYHDLRHYYFYCLEGYQRLTLYRREDRSWCVLEEENLPVDRSRYYDLKVEVSGERISCFLDGEKVFEVKDPVFPRGKVGIRTNTISRFKSVLVTATPRAVELVNIARRDYESRLEELRERYPRPVLWRKIDKSKLGLCHIRIGDIFGPGRVGIVLFAHRGLPDTPDLITGMGLDGDIVWQIERSGDAQTARLADIDGDGGEEIICVRDGRLQILDGATGEVQAERELPLSGPFVGRRRETLKPAYGLYVANLRGREFPQDVVIHDGEPSGGNSLWAFDDKLDPLWAQTVTYPRFGHHISFYDVDGDGREEVAAGYHLLDHDGEIIWVMEGAEYIRYEEHVGLTGRGKMKYRSPWLPAARASFSWMPPPGRCSGDIGWAIARGSGWGISGRTSPAWRYGLATAGGATEY